MSGYEDEKSTNGDVDDDENKQDHQSTLVEQLPNIGLLDAGEAHEGIFTETGEGEDRVETVLLRSKGEDTDCEGKDDL